MPRNQLGQPVQAAPLGSAPPNQVFVVHSSGALNENTGNVGKPKIHGVALTKQSARQMQERVTSENWEKHGPVGENVPGEYPEHFAAIAKKHGVDQSSVVLGDHPNAKPGDTGNESVHWGTEDDEGEFKPHAGLHKDLTAFENGPTPYPGMAQAHEHFRSQDNQEHLIPYVTPTTIG